MYHQKDEMLARDGFKKFMKYEPCSFAGCPYSHISNHIHCIRPGQFLIQRLLGPTSARRVKSGVKKMSRDVFGQKSVRRSQQHIGSQDV
jgi:hypothetical protein